MPVGLGKTVHFEHAPTTVPIVAFATMQPVTANLVQQALIAQLAHAQMTALATESVQIGPAFVTVGSWVLIVH